MMVIDASFLIEFLQIHAANSSAQVLARSLSKRIESERTKIFFNMMLRDIMMLENQMPLFLLRKLLGLQLPTKELASDELARVLAVFAKEVSPIKSMENFPLVDDVASRPHLLDLLYCMVVPRAAGTDENVIAEEEEGGEGGEAAKELVEGELGADSTGVVKKAFAWGWTSVLSGMNRGPMRIVKRVIVAKPVRLVVKFPWKVVSALPIFSIVKQPVESFFSQIVGGGKDKSDDEGAGSAGHADRPPLAEEIAIPSVAQLCAAGVQFQPRNGDVTTVEFDAKTATLYLPVVSLDVNTEVLLRNLVAYEASAVSGPLVFTRYTELMNGIIDTEEDVRILRERGVVVNRMKSDGEAAALWNGMSKSVRLTKVGFLDKVIRDVNKYYRSRWRVKSREFMKKYVFGSWQVLTLLAAALLLFLTCVQAFCSVYSCNSRITKFSSVAN
ncbi:putative UPF0481 protein [Iris pallida]|uniref:UPF0481 protein n=1 Tax=Iris pallida TaxID=29817 RepID=A0AAX6GLU5_IRIPA|nr:putative UPF0481 protein [Iris pallida]